MAVTKAKIAIEPGSEIAPDDTIECLFNPEQFSLGKSAQWKPDDARGSNAPKMYFEKGGASTLDLELILDTTDLGTTVTVHTERLLKLVEVNPNLPNAGDAIHRPPTVRFIWGEFTSFESYVKQVSITYTFFSSAGVPLRAKATVAMEQAEDDTTWLPQNPTSGTPHPHRVHVLQVGETLDALAAIYYGDPTRWRVIADENGVGDPLRVMPGTALAVPLSGEALGV